MVAQVYWVKKGTPTKYMSLGNHIQVDIEYYSLAEALRYCSTKSSLAETSGVITTHYKGKCTYDTVCFPHLLLPTIKMVWFLPSK